MTLKRTMDAAFLNSVANHADVRPWLGGNGELDLTSLVSDPANVCLQNEFGGFVCQKLEVGVFECHSMFLKEGRGPAVIQAMQDCLRYLFVRTDCLEAVTKLPEGNNGARACARVLGFSVTYRLDKGWAFPAGAFGPVDCASLKLSDWTQTDAVVESKGKWFHDRLEELTAEAGKTIPAHYDEPSHNKAVGAAVLMFEAGNPGKAVATYNTWARRSGFAPIRALSFNPVILDMDQVIVEVSHGDMEVLLCR